MPSNLQKCDRSGHAVARPPCARGLSAAAASSAGPAPPCLSPQDCAQESLGKITLDFETMLRHACWVRRRFLRRATVGPQSPPLGGPAGRPSAAPGTGAPGSNAQQRRRPTRAARGVRVLSRGDILESVTPWRLWFFPQRVSPRPAPFVAPFVPIAPALAVAHGMAAMLEVDEGSGLASQQSCVAAPAARAATQR